jgi:hypothetical protein
MTAHGECVQLHAIYYGAHIHAQTHGANMGKNWILPNDPYQNRMSAVIGASIRYAHSNFHICHYSRYYLHCISETRERHILRNAALPGVATSSRQRKLYHTSRSSSIAPGDENLCLATSGVRHTAQPQWRIERDAQPSAFGTLAGGSFFLVLFRPCRVFPMILICIAVQSMMYDMFSACFFCHNLLQRVVLLPRA